MRIENGCTLFVLFLITAIVISIVWLLLKQAKRLLIKLWYNFRRIPQVENRKQIINLIKTPVYGTCRNNS